MTEPNEADLLALGRILARFLSHTQPYAYWNDASEVALLERLYGEEPSV